MKEKIYRAGVIPYIDCNNSIKMLFMLPSDPKYGGSDFQIAKGKRDLTDIDDLDTAIREGYEELGLLKDNIDNITDVGIVLGRTHIYIVKVKSMENFAKPHFETSATRWMTIEEFRLYGRVIHLQVVEKAYKLIIE